LTKFLNDGMLEDMRMGRTRTFVDVTQEGAPPESAPMDTELSGVAAGILSHSIGAEPEGLDGRGPIEQGLDLLVREIGGVPRPQSSASSEPALEPPEEDALPVVPMEEEATEVDTPTVTDRRREIVARNNRIDGFGSVSSGSAAARALPYPAIAGTSFLPPFSQSSSNPGERFLSVFSFEKESFETFDDAKAHMDSTSHNGKTMYATFFTGPKWYSEKSTGQMKPVSEGKPFLKLDACACFFPRDRRFLLLRNPKHLQVRSNAIV